MTEWLPVIVLLIASIRWFFIGNTRANTRPVVRTILDLLCIAALLFGIGIRFYINGITSPALP